MQQITFTTLMKTNNTQSLTLEDFISKINDSYDEDDKEGTNCYEYFNLLEKEFKPFFDFDVKLNKKEFKEFNINLYQNKITDKLNRVCNAVNEVWAISEDHRITKIEDKKIWKVSLHFILTNKKTNAKSFYPYIRKVNYLFKQDKIEFDTSVYRKGMGKFRMSQTKKEGDKHSLLKPVTFKDDITKHIIQVVDGLDEFIITKEMNLLVNNNIDKDENIRELVSGYTVVSKKEKNNCTFMDLDKETICPFIGRKHTNNHIFLVQTEDCLMIKCHSDKCSSKVKILFKNMNSDTIDFDLDVFNAFQIKDGSNYPAKRDYFEKYYKYFRDTNTFYRIQMNYNNRYKYYERELVEIQKGGLADLQIDQYTDKFV